MMQISRAFSRTPPCGDISVTKVRPQSGIAALCLVIMLSTAFGWTSRAQAQAPVTVVSSLPAEVAPVNEILDLVGSLLGSLTNDVDTGDQSPSNGDADPPGGGADPHNEFPPSARSSAGSPSDAGASPGASQQAGSAVSLPAGTRQGADTNGAVSPPARTRQGADTNGATHEPPPPLRGVDPVQRPPSKGLGSPHADVDKEREVQSIYQASGDADRGKVINLMVGLVALALGFLLQRGLPAR